MKYNGFYFWMFKSPMKKVLAEKYGREYAADIMKKSKKVYRELVEKADDIGDDSVTIFVRYAICLSFLLIRHSFSHQRRFDGNVKCFPCVPRLYRPARRSCNISRSSVCSYSCPVHKPGYGR